MGILLVDMKCYVILVGLNNMKIKIKEIIQIIFYDKYTNEIVKIWDCNIPYFYEGVDKNDSKQ